MQNPSVSVIVPTFNRAHYLGECLESLIAQTVPAKEIWVIDDGSEDSTRDVIRRFGDRIQYVYKENGGKPNAVNLGLTRCTGSLVWIFDDDDVAIPTAIEHRLAALRDVPGAAWVYSSHHLGVDGPERKIVKGRLCSPLHPASDAFFLEIMRGCFFHLNTALVKRELYLKAGGLDPDLHTGEDYDMQIRLARIATPAYCSSPSFIFRQHSGVRGSKVIRHEASDRMRVFRQYSASIGRKIRAQVDLAEFLVPPRQSPVAEADLRSALLNRAHVMANHGCLPELLEDVHRHLSSIPAAQTLSDEEYRHLSRVIRTGFAYEAASQDWPSFVRSLRSFKRYRGGRRVIRAFANGLFSLAKSYPASISRRLATVRQASRLLMEGVA